MSIEVGGVTYLTAGEAAKFLGVSDVTFAKFVKMYKLSWMTRLGQGKRKFFKQDDLASLLELKPGQEQEKEQKQEQQV